MIKVESFISGENDKYHGIGIAYLQNIVTVRIFDKADFANAGVFRLVIYAFAHTLN